MTTKQRAILRGMANTMDTILYIGKEGTSRLRAPDALEAGN